MVVQKVTFFSVWGKSVFKTFISSTFTIFHKYIPYVKGFALSLNDHDCIPNCLSVHDIDDGQMLIKKSQASLNVHEGIGI